MLAYHATSAWPMLRSEGGLDAESAISFLGRKGSEYKNGPLTLQGTRLPYGKRMADTAV